MGIANLYNHIFKVWRAKRLAQFQALIAPVGTDQILDVGGYPHTWLTTPQVADRIDCLNLTVYPWPEEKNYPGHRIQIVEGNGCDMHYMDKSYPIVFSNSVIEHVGDLEAQRAFAREVRRVGNKLWIQTPAYECPIEPHYLTPFMHWFPKGFQRKIARYFTVWGLLEKPDRNLVNEMVDNTRLLTKAEMKSLFPDCRILTERMLWVIPKSYVAVRT